MATLKTAAAMQAITPRFANERSWLPGADSPILVLDPAGELAGQACQRREPSTMLLGLAFFVFGALVLYWVIRSAVSSGIKDALIDVEAWKRSLDD